MVYKYLVGNGRYYSRVLLYKNPEIDFVIFKMNGNWCLCTRKNHFNWDGIAGELEFYVGNHPLGDLPYSFVLKWLPENSENQDLKKILEKIGSVNVKQPV